MALFVVERAHGPAWDPARGLREQDGWDEHAAFMDELVDEGWIVLGGPLGDDAALLVVEAADRAEIDRRLDADPWTPTGHLHTARAEPWTILLDSRR